MFCDFSGFTKHAENVEPKALIELLNQYFSAFYKINFNHKLEKIKTIGDAYMCASGLPSESRGHAIRICLAALEFQNYLDRSNQKREQMRMQRWDMRTCIHTGPVIAGVVGERKFTYDIWGDSVNIAALMEQNSEPSRVHISETTYQHVGEIFEIESRGIINSGKKGDLSMCFLSLLKEEFSEDPDGLKPNNEFQKKFGGQMKIYDAWNSSDEIIEDAVLTLLWSDLGWLSG